jgi:hypothetical protein
MSRIVNDVEGFIVDFYMRQAALGKKRKKKKRREPQSSDIFAFVTAKALVIAIKVLEQERPYRQSAELTEMRRLLRVICVAHKFKLALFDREVAFIDAKTSAAIQEASARNWAAAMDRLVKDHGLTPLDHSPFEG